MPTLDPTLVIACRYSPMRRALIELLQAEFPDVRIRVVYDLAHLTLGIGDGVDGVFVDSSVLSGRISAIHDVYGQLPVLVCDTPDWYGPDAPRAEGATSASLRSALPTLCGMFPLVSASAVLKLERLLVGRFFASRPILVSSEVATTTSEDAGLDEHSEGYVLEAI